MVYSIKRKSFQAAEPKVYFGLIGQCVNDSMLGHVKYFSRFNEFPQENRAIAVTQTTAPGPGDVK